MNLNRRCFTAALAGAAAVLFTGCSTTSIKPTADTRCYEMRIYYSPAGRLDDLHARFRNHTMKLFKKHGIESIAYWVPIENPDNKLVYLLAYPSREARDASWKAFMNDPEWKAVQKQTEANGRIVAKVESFYLQTTDYSPKVRTGNVSHSGVFEMRTYTTPPGRLANLDARFRDHTIQLFARHGIGNQGYFHKMKDQANADTTLLYFVTHKSQAGAKESFAAFGKDPEWVAARKASEEAAGGSLTVQGGVKSEFLIPTDYSPTK